MLFSGIAEYCCCCSFIKLFDLSSFLSLDAGGTDSADALDVHNQCTIRLLLESRVPVSVATSCDFPALYVYVFLLSLILCL